jgi:hypothetical protein
MPSTPYAGRTRFGLLPEPESNPASFLNQLHHQRRILALLIVFGTVAHHELQLRKMESTEIVFPTTPPPEIKVKVKMPPPPKLPPPPEPKIAKLEAPKIFMPKIEPKPEVKPIQWSRKRWRCPIAGGQAFRLCWLRSPRLRWRLLLRR